MSGANVCPGLVSRATIPKRSAEAACWRRFTTKSSSTRSEMTSLSRRHVPSVKTRLLVGGERSTSVSQHRNKDCPLVLGCSQGQIRSCKATSCVSMIPRPGPDLKLLAGTSTPGKNLQLQVTCETSTVACYLFFLVQ